MTQALHSLDQVRDIARATMGFEERRRFFHWISGEVERRADAAWAAFNLSFDDHHSHQRYWRIRKEIRESPEFILDCIIEMNRRLSARKATISSIFNAS